MIKGLADHMASLQGADTIIEYETDRKILETMQQTLGILEQTLKNRSEATGVATLDKVLTDEAQRTQKDISTLLQQRAQDERAHLTGTVEKENQAIAERRAYLKGILDDTVALPKAQRDAILAAERAWEVDQARLVAADGLVQARERELEKLKSIQAALQAGASVADRILDDTQKAIDKGDKASVAAAVLPPIPPQTMAEYRQAMALVANMADRQKELAEQTRLAGEASKKAAALHQLVAPALNSITQAMMNQKFDWRELLKSIVQPVIGKLQANAISEYAEFTTEAASLNPAVVAHAPMHLTAALKNEAGAVAVAALAGAAAGGGSGGGGGGGAAPAAAGGTSSAASNATLGAMNQQPLQIVVTIQQAAPDGRIISSIRQQIQRAVDKQTPIRVTL
jgi:hypothetical protein